MGIFDRRAPDPVLPPSPPDSTAAADEQAIARYRYLLRTAPPEAIEQAHAEAFAQLTPDQRRLLLQRLAAAAPEAERRPLEQAGSDPQALARAATRAEIRQPGVLERMFGGGAAPGFGGLMAGSLLGSVAGTVLGSVIAREFMDHSWHHDPGSGAGADPSSTESDQHAFLDHDDSGSGDDLGGDLGDLGDFDSGSFDV